MEYAIVLLWFCMVYILAKTVLEFIITSPDKRSNHNDDRGW